MKFLKGIFESILEFFFPSHCFVCEEAVADGKLICDKCYKELERLPEKYCLVCGCGKDKCKCANYVFYFSKSCSPFFNSGGAKKGIYALKFHSKTVNTDFFAKEMTDCVKKYFPEVKFDAVCYVPAHPLKALIRGFDQSRLLGKSISESLEIPFVENALKRKVLSKTQHKSNDKKARYENAFKSYYSTKQLNNKIVLLVDDIKTSGASLNACSRSLLYAGAKEVYCVTALNTK